MLGVMIPSKIAGGDNYSADFVSSGYDCVSLPQRDSIMVSTSQKEIIEGHTSIILSPQS